jgi:hypothetical protein
VNCAARLSPFLMTRTAAGGEQAKTHSQDADCRSKARRHKAIDDGFHRVAENDVGRRPAQRPSEGHQRFHILQRVKAAQRHRYLRKGNFDRGQGLNGASMKFGTISNNLMTSFHHGLEELKSKIHQRDSAAADNGNSAPARMSLKYRRTNRSAYRIAALNAGGTCARHTARAPALERLYSRNSRALLCRSQECCTR